jgi:hypothetical protein
VTDITLRDVDPVLHDRMRRVAELRGWSMPQTLAHLLEQGLFAYEDEGRPDLDTSEDDVLKAAIAALEEVPDDVYACIGKTAGNGAGDGGQAG